MGSTVLERGDIAFLDHVGLELLLVAAGDHATVGEDDVATGRPEPPRAAEDLGLAPVTAGAGDDWSD
jgi:hypothetical protein